ncbi:uncharacterized protein LOC105692477 [Athalia rosae]|uniref:uncharacterized protein LOC105692477 n=1 Tax=Athalia rosae TaxID=37344 RepID=UPI002033AA12|nr:uncharacterized protein LOC105692477 [Athalia rosae]
MVDMQKVEFAVGSEVSPASFYKSAFARSFAMNSRETKSLDFGFMNNETIAEEPTDCNVNTDSKNNNFVSQHTGGKQSCNTSDVKLWRIHESATDNDAATEVNKLRKECQTLAEENRRLQGTLAAGRTSHSRVIDNVLLQTQIDTLQWQLKQTEANRQMYRALMGQVVRFLERAHKGLDILHEKSNPKSTKTLRVPRSRSVHAVDASSPSRAADPTSANFARAKSVTQISPTSNPIRDSTSVWSVLRRNDNGTPLGTPPRPDPRELNDNRNQTHDGVVYRRRPKQSENNPDEVPPERLAQEAFRLMRTVQSLLATREPDLVRASEGEENGSPSPSCDHEMSLPTNFANSTSLHDSSFSACSSSDRASSRTDHDTSFNFRKVSSESNGSCLMPGVRRSLDATSLHSGSSKTTETTEEEDPGPRSLLTGVLEREFSGTPSSTPIRRKKPSEPDVPIFKPKPTASVSSAEDESGFSSMSSFQDVGLPAAPSPIKGCHTEVGLPEVPINKVRHRRWSSTPAEMQALLNGRHNASFAGAKTTSEALKVLWV